MPELRLQRPLQRRPHGQRPVHVQHPICHAQRRQQHRRHVQRLPRRLRRRQLHRLPAHQRRHLQWPGHLPRRLGAHRSVLVQRGLEPQHRLRHHHVRRQHQGRSRAVRLGHSKQQRAERLLLQCLLVPPRGHQLHHGHGAQLLHLHDLQCLGRLLGGGLVRPLRVRQWPHGPRRDVRHGRGRQQPGAVHVRPDELFGLLPVQLGHVAERERADGAMRRRGDHDELAGPGVGRAVRRRQQRERRRLQQHVPDRDGLHVPDGRFAVHSVRGVQVWHPLHAELCVRAGQRQQLQQRGRDVLVQVAVDRHQLRRAAGAVGHAADAVAEHDQRGRQHDVDHVHGRVCVVAVASGVPAGRGRELPRGLGGVAHVADVVDHASAERGPDDCDGVLGVLQSGRRQHVCAANGDTDGRCAAGDDVVDLGHQPRNVDDQRRDVANHVLGGDPVVDHAYRVHCQRGRLHQPARRDVAGQRRQCGSHGPVQRHRQLPSVLLN
eukprot:Unigene683_Nuclearia_a/m.2150 Unigene683_Nuclearia_a/g.2150  ORF Unigene683_Nuclearia_a/g.2150 Unigene683_Nuclearia_a/m.2150 type:complete len:490 (-) Unigene683_Nuclearia_a:734-2203(-)